MCDWLLYYNTSHFELLIIRKVVQTELYSTIKPDQEQN